MVVDDEPVKPTPVFFLAKISSAIKYLCDPNFMFSIDPEKKISSAIDLRGINPEPMTPPPGEMPNSC
jgi:hypothetical protein